MQLIISKLLPKVHTENEAFFSLNFSRTSCTTGNAPCNRVGVVLEWGGGNLIPAAVYGNLISASVAAVT